MITTGVGCWASNSCSSCTTCVCCLGGQSVSARPTLLQSAAREFLQIFGQVSEPPLLPYYHALRTEYFPWVRALAR